MRLSKPRVEPLEVDAMDPEIRAAFGDGPVLNIFRTLAHHPKLLKRWLVFGNHVLAKSSIGAREREMAILRTGHRCRAGYEWGQHVPIGLASGLGEDEIARIAEGPDAPGWSDLDRAILRAADELHDDQFVSDATWDALSAHWNVQQLMDLVFAVGQYTLVSMALNTLGVQLEEGAPEMPA
jgi:alkylhydroperoxidase family enzyme